MTAAEGGGGSGSVCLSVYDVKAEAWTYTSIVHVCLSVT